MADDHNLSDKMNGAEATSSNGFELFQRQLDVFLEQEKKAAITEAEHGSNKLQHRLDHFINNLQHKLDSFMEETPVHTSMVSDSDNIRPQSDRQLVQTVPDQPEKTPAQPAKKQPALAVPAMPGTANSASYVKLILIVLIAASCAVAAILWFVWPVEQAASPQLVQQQGVDAYPALLAPLASETLASKTVAVHEAIEPVAKKSGINKTAEAVLSQPVFATQPKTMAQHYIPNIETVIQAKASVTVRLKVTASIGNIRNKPDRSGKVLFRLAQGAVVIRLAEQQGWFKVRLRNGVIAWAHRSIFQPDP